EERKDRRGSAAKQSPHRPVLAPALGLRAGMGDFFIVPQTTFRKETPTMLLPSWLGLLRPASPRSPAQRHRNRRPPACRLHVEPLEDRCLLVSGLSATLVADIVPGSQSSSPEGLTNVNGTLYFGAVDPSTGYGLWKSDGTGPGT